MSMAGPPVAVPCPQAFDGYPSVPACPTVPAKQGVVQNIESRIAIAIERQPTAGTDVCPDTQGFVDAGATRRAVRRRPLGSHRDHGNGMHHAVGFHPGEELSPPSIVNGFGQMTIPDQVADLQVFKGKKTR